MKFHSLLFLTFAVSVFYIPIQWKSQAMEIKDALTQIFLRHDTAIQQLSRFNSVALSNVIAGNFLIASKLKINHLGTRINHY